MERANDVSDPRESAEARRRPRWRQRATAASAWLHQYQTLLWWLHSAWALAFGIGVMWLGSRNFTYLRLAVVHVCFIWITSFALPWVIGSTHLPAPWRRRVQLAINYFNKNFYQQLLFFILPVFALSTTYDSANVVYLAVLATCAVLSTLDLVYDRHLAVHRPLTAAFFACSAFAGVAAGLPIVWGVPPETAVRVAGLAAAVGVMTLLITERRADWQRTWFVGGMMVLALALLVEYGRHLVPPAPLRLASVAFGTDIDRSRITMRAPVDALPPEYEGAVYVLTSIYAPLGLHDRVRHVWYLEDERIWASRWYDVDGGREEGYRLWTGRGGITLGDSGRLHVDVETEGGQLIGRARLRAARPD